MKKLRRPTYRFSVLIAIAAALGACSGTKEDMDLSETQAFDDLRSEVTVVVSDVDRRNQVLVQIDDLEAILSKLDKDMEERVQQFRELYTNYDTTQADLEVAAVRVQEQMQSNFEELSAQYRQLSTLVTPEEWDSLDKAKSKAMEAAVASMLDRAGGES